MTDDTQPDFHLVGDDAPDDALPWEDEPSPPSDPVPIDVPPPPPDPGPVAPEGAGPDK